MPTIELKRAAVKQAEQHRAPRWRMRQSVAVGTIAAVAVAVYVGATVLGGLLDPGYSHLSMHISALTASDAPDRTLLAALYAGYNLLLAALGIAMLRALPRSRSLVVASSSLMITSVVGVLLVTLFLQDLYGAPTTTGGTIHIALAGVGALLTVVVMVAAGRAFRVSPLWRGLARLSMFAAAFTIASGLVAAIGTAAMSPWMGLLERLPIGAFLAWLTAVSWCGLRSLSAPRDLTPHAA
jgi:hypothetical protein